MARNERHVRQIWESLSSTTSSIHSHCTPFTLPSGGILKLNVSATLTLTQTAFFAPVCGADSAPSGTTSINHSTVVGLQDPFYASLAPQIYAIATATVVAYLLVIILFITPRTFFVGGPGGGDGFLGRRGMISGSYGTSSIVGVGRRPWLQKIAAVTVAISLTIATADTFGYAKEQYEHGYSDAQQLIDQVVTGLEIRIVLVISDTFLWLAQVQTLIRLFPRHKEKVTIKWLGFALILFDTVFSILNSFVYQSSKTRPRQFQQAIPALTYLFELGIGLIYASCVIYYALSKRRFAFWHPKMRNICLVALLSLVAVLIPVVFFVLDVSKPDVSGWGSYIRWVGAAAASVVVWEWVERIEALERDERKDGVLGREIFDGDEMLGITQAEEVDWPGRRDDYDYDSGEVARGGTVTRRHRLRSRIPFRDRIHSHMSERNLEGPSGAGTVVPLPTNLRHPVFPPQATTPISRSDTSSAASTVYAVRYHTINSPSPQIPEEKTYNGIAGKEEVSIQGPLQPVVQTGTVSEHNMSDNIEMNRQDPAACIEAQPKPSWHSVVRPFKRRRSSPPVEVADAQSSEEQTSRLSSTTRRPKWNLKFKRDVNAIAQRERLHIPGLSRHAEAPLAVTVIPAQRRGQRTWSPDETSDPGNRQVGSVTQQDELPQKTQDQQPATTSVSEVARPDLPAIVVPAPSRSQRAWSPQTSTHPTSSLPLQDSGAS